jgi:hypothetical protein
MSGRGGGGGGRGGRGGGRGRGRGSTGTALMGREMLKRSAVEAGLLGKGGKSSGDPGNAFFADIMRPTGPLYGPFLWHSSGNVRGAADDASSTNNDAMMMMMTTMPTGLVSSGAVVSTPDAAMSNFSAAAAGKGNSKKAPVPPIAVTKRTPSMTFLVSRQRELMERFQASTHHVRIHPQIDVARYNSGNNGNHNNKATPPDVAIREESMSKKLAKDERYIPVEILYPSAASLAMSRSNLMEANRKRRRQQELDELEKQELGNNGGAVPFGEEEEDDADNDDEFDQPPEEQEEGEDYTTNYYDTEDESAGGDGDEATF